MNQSIRTMAVALVLGCVSAAQSNTWTVGASGGQFADIQPAIAAASPGDKILVAAGNYSNFVLDKGISIIGTPGSHVPEASVHCDTPGETVLIAGLKVEHVVGGGSGGTVSFVGCTLGGSTSLPMTEVASLAGIDVRFHASTVKAPTRYGTLGGVKAATCVGRVEIVSSTMTGGSSINGENSGSACWSGYWNCSAPAGGDAVVGSGLHIVSSTLRGGDGADYRFLNVGLGVAEWCATDGGHGLVSNDFIAIAVNSFGGGRGAGGGSVCYGSFGAWGSGLVGNGVRQTGCRLRPAPGSGAPGAIPRDPYLTGSDIVDLGIQTVHLTFKGATGASVALEIGAPTVIDDGQNAIKRLTTATTSLALGSVPQGNILHYDWAIPMSAMPGDAYYMQAVQRDPTTGQLLGRTNSVIVVVR